MPTQRAVDTGPTISDTATLAGSARDVAVMTAPASVAVIGAGWRAGYAIRVAAERPDLLRISGVYARSEESAGRISARWGVPVSTDLSHVLTAGSPDLAFVCVPREAVAPLARSARDAGLPMLLETPPAPDVGGLFALYEEMKGHPVMVAEQYHLQPHHAARIAAVRAGLLGQVHTATVSVAHDYHAVSLLRMLLGVGFEDVRIGGTSRTDRVLGVRSRDGWKAEPEIIDSTVVNGTFEWDGRLGRYDFASEQYRSPLRSRHLSVQGVRGELVDDDVVTYERPGLVSRRRLVREQTGVDGDLAGAHLHQISLGQEVLVENRLAPARLSDDEIAVGESLLRTVEHLRGGPAPYPLADACEDAYLGLLLHEAVSTGVAVSAGDRPWAEERSVTQR